MENFFVFVLFCFVFLTKKLDGKLELNKLNTLDEDMILVFLPRNKKLHIFSNICFHFFF